MIKEDLATFKPKSCQCVMYFSPNHIFEKDHLIKIEKCDLHKELSFDDILSDNKSKETPQPIEPSEIELRLDALEALLIGEQSTLSKIRGALKL